MNERTTATDLAANDNIDVPSYVWLKLVKRPYSPVANEGPDEKAVKRPPRLSEAAAKELNKNVQLVFTRTTWSSPKKADDWKEAEKNAWWFDGAESVHLVEVDAG